MISGPTMVRSQTLRSSRNRIELDIYRMRSLKAAKRIFCVLLSSCALVLLASAATQKDYPAAAALSIPIETVCVGSQGKPMEATIAFTNRSQKNILVKTSGGRTVTVLGLFGTRKRQPLLSSWMSMSDQGGGGKSADSFLKPGETTNYQFEFELPANLLAEPGFYKVQVSYDVSSQTTDPAAESIDFVGRTNWAIFQVSECPHQ
jgi:hypothetical protein